MTEALAGLAGVIEPNGTSSSPNLGLDLEKISEKAKADKEENERERKRAMEVQAAALEDDSAARKPKAKKVFGHTTKLTAAGGAEIVFDLSHFPPGSKLSMADMNLEVGGGTVVLTSKFGEALAAMPEGADEETVGAKLSQKKRTLTVKVAGKREKL